MNLKLREMTTIAIFASLTAIGAFIRIPTPTIPFTLQFLFCAYSGIFLGSKNGFYSQILYIAIGLIGIPIFANGGGLSYVFQPTFGYLLGFVACSYVIGRITERFMEVKFIKLWAAVLAGLFFVYLFGVGYLYLIFNLHLHKQMTIVTAITVGLLPYITTDVMLSVVIAITGVRVIPILKKNGYYKSLH